MRLPLASGGQEAVDALLHEAMAEQSFAASTVRATDPGRPAIRDYVPLPRL